MLHLQLRPFTVLVVFLLLTHSCGGQHHMIGPPQPIVALVGDNITLPSHIEPAVDASDMTVEWSRPDLHPRFVHVWRDGVELESKKHSSYRGRTSLLVDKLKDGDVSLNLTRVKLCDEGTYRCFLPGLSQASLVELVVGVVSSPVIEISNSTRGELQCECKGWYPEPEVLWLDSEGHVLSAGPAETLRGPDGLYTVSSRVTVEKRHSNRFTCKVQQKDINQIRETQIQVPDDFFEVHSSSAAVVGFTLCMLLILAAVFVLWKWRQKKFKTKIGLEDGEEDEEEKKNKSTSTDPENWSLMEAGRNAGTTAMNGDDGQKHSGGSALQTEVTNRRQTRK
ncbi:butyrophilin subfamily 3 member A2-like [Symphorus nematophorus]